MFKYLWIIMLAIPILSVICYTVHAIRKSFKDAINYAETAYDYNKNIKWIISKTLTNFRCAHYDLYMMWLVLLLFGIIILFVTSLITYTGE